MSTLAIACARWMALSDREALGETVTAGDAAFLVDHTRACAACRAEASVWQSLSAIVDGASDAPRGASKHEVAAARVDRGRRWFWLGGTAATSAAAVIVWIAVREPRPELATPVQATPRLVTAAPDALVVVAAMSGGALEVDGRPASLGQQLTRGSRLVARHGSVCIVVEPKIRACMTRGSSLRLSELGAARRLALGAGKVSVELDPLPVGDSFGIVTRQGTAIAIGTSFSVEVPPDDAPVLTRVTHGKVLVRSADGREQRVAAHEQTSMHDASPFALAAVDEELDRLLLTAPGAGLDAAPSPRAPVPAAPVLEATSAVRSPSQLLVEIRERRASGDLDGSTAAYRELFERHGSSPEAHAALVSWGELQLTRLGDPDGALVSFDRYLARGGALAEEAMSGRVRALRSLGRVEAERAAIASFLRRFPEAPLAPSLAERLRSLEEK